MSEALDATRLTLILNELRLPAVKHVWPKFAERSDKEGCRLRGSWRSLPNMSSPNAIAVASSGIWARRACCPARPLRTSTSTPCR